MELNEIPAGDLRKSRGHRVIYSDNIHLEQVPPSIKFMTFYFAGSSSFRCAANKGILEYTGWPVRSFQGGELNHDHKALEKK